MFLLGFFAAKSAVVGSGCDRKAKAGNIIYIDWKIESTQSTMYDPASRTLGREVKTTYKTLKKPPRGPMVDKPY
jgi:hypothetical protein